MLTDNIEALKDCWLVGDEFLMRQFAGFQALKTSASIKKIRYPYLYEHYNIRCYYQNPLSANRCGIGRIWTGMEMEMIDSKAMGIEINKEGMCVGSSIKVSVPLAWDASLNINAHCV